MTSSTKRTVSRYGLIGWETRGQIKWFDTPAQLAEAWQQYPDARLRVFVNGEVSFGTAEDVKPVYDALDALREEV